MTREVNIVVTGFPVAKGRGRAVQTQNGPRIYTPKATAKFEADVRQEARRVMADENPIYGPVRVWFHAVFTPASSWPQWKQEAATAGALKHTGKPDVDNLVKSAQDAMNGIVFADDQAIFEMHVTKGYGWSPRIEVTVESVDQPNSASEWRELRDLMGY